MNSPVSGFIQGTSSEFRAEIPPKRRGSAIISCLAFIVLLALIGHVVIERLPNAPRIVFGVLVTVFGVVCGSLILAWELWGVQTIELNGSELTVRDKMFGFKRVRNYEVARMKHLHVCTPGRQTNASSGSEGRIHFEYEDALVCIGGNINEEQASQIVDRIRKQMTNDSMVS